MRRAALAKGITSDNIEFTIFTAVKKPPQGWQSEISIFRT